MVRPTTLVVTGLILIGVGISVGWFAFPKLLHSKITEAKQLRKGTENRKNWSKFPISLDFKIYLWNITNPDEVYKGAKPTVQEIGPFFYREWKAKTNIEDDAEQDTITYNAVNTFYFDPEETKPLTGDEILTLPHVLLVALSQLVMVQKPSALTMVNKGIPHLFNDPKTIFFQTTAKKFLFDGVTVNCTKAKEFAANALCDQIRADPKGLKKMEDGTFKFSMFGMVNNTVNENKITVKRGMKNIQEVGQVVLYNGKPTMEYWNGEYCNQIKGTDTTIFPPFMDPPPEEVWNFGAEICRSLPLVYKEPKVYKGIRGLLYTADLGDMSTEPNSKCFCPTNTTCLKKGAYDVTKCTGAPLVLTQPHCYNCHLDYLNMVNGYNPSVDRHGLYTTFEPITGNPVEGHRRLQFNLWIYKIPKISIMKDLPEEPILLPFMWLDEGVELNDTMCSMVRNLLYRPVKIVHITRVLLVIVGFLLLCAAVFVHYKRSKLNLESNSSNDEKKTTVTQVSPAY